LGGEFGDTPLRGGVDVLSPQHLFPVSLARVVRGEGGFDKTGVTTTRPVEVISAFDLETINSMVEEDSFNPLCGHIQTVPGGLGGLDDGAKSLVRDPNGCILAESATNFPYSTQKHVTKTSEVLEEKVLLKPKGPLFQSIEPTFYNALEPKSIGVSEEFLYSLGDYTQTYPSVLREIDDSLANFIPSYKDVLNRSPLPICSGGEPIPSSSIKVPLDEKLKRASMSSSVGVSTDLKGAMFGGLETDFSPLKMRRARKLGKERETNTFLGTLVIDGIRALRSQKSLERVKK
jgi:hypothetical protein